MLQEDLERLLDWEKDWGMTFHPSKCQVISVTKKRKIVNFDYVMKGHILEKVESVKYLGVTIDKGGSWNNHINNVTASSHKTLSFLQRNLSQCPMSIKKQSLDRSKVEYATTIWDPHTKSTIDKQEMIQRKEARFVCGDFRRYSSVTEMLQRLQWEPLQARRKACKLVMMYKTVNNQVDLSLLISICNNPHHILISSYNPSLALTATNLVSSLQRYDSGMDFLHRWLRRPPIGIFRPAMQAVVYQTY